MSGGSEKTKHSHAGVKCLKMDGILLKIRKVLTRLDTDFLGLVYVHLFSKYIENLLARSVSFVI